MRILIVGSALVITTVGCQRQETPVEVADRARIAIERHNANLIRWYATGQIDSVGPVFAENAWQFPPNQHPLAGRDSIVSYWRTATGWGRWEFDFDIQDVAASGPLAVERGRYTLKFTPGPASPIPAVDDHGNYVVLWREDRDGVWRAVWDAPVSEVPLPQPSAPQ